MKTNAIEIKNLVKAYPDFLLRDISLNLPSGTIMGLVGENGAGKSTLIKLIMNATSREGGTIKVLGMDNRSPEFNLVKEDIGIVLDEAHFPEYLTGEQVGKVMERTYKNWDTATYNNYLDKFSLPKDKNFKDFSRGMKMKLAIAVALSHSPRLLILDEATGGLDPMVRDEILDVFRDFVGDENHSVLLSSHIVSDLEKICDYIAFIHKGRLEFCEEKDRLLEDYAIVKMTEEAFKDIPDEAVMGVKKGDYGVEALVKKAEISPVFPVEHTTLEEIILFKVKAEHRGMKRLIDLRDRG